MPQATTAALAEGSWIDDRESIIFHGRVGQRQDTPSDGLGGLCLPAGAARALHNARANELAEAESRRELARPVAGQIIPGNPMGPARQTRDYLRGK